MPWPTNFTPPYICPDMDYTLFKWLAPTLEYMEGGGKSSPGSQMLVVVVLWRGKSRRSFRCPLQNVIERFMQSKVKSTDYTCIRLCSLWCHSSSAQEAALLRIGCAVIDPARECWRNFCCIFVTSCSAR